jgi:hypothetical protein
VRTKVTLVLLFLNVALFFFIFKFERNWRTEAAAQETRRRVLGPEAADIRWLEVTGPGGELFTLEKKNDTWWLKKPLEWPANPHAVNRIVLDLQLLEHERSFPTKQLGQEGAPTLADYGLEKPKLTVAFSSGERSSGTPTALGIGDITKVGNRLFVLSPDRERIHVVNRSLADSLTLPLEQLRGDTLLTVPVFEARSLAIHTGGPGESRGTAAGGLRIRIRRDGMRWVFETPIVARASKLAIDQTINDLNGLHPGAFEPQPRPDVLPSAAPTLRLMLEGNNRHETLFLGEPVAGAAAAANAAASPQIEYYAQLDGRKALFTVSVPARLLETLRNAQVTLREKRLLEFEPRTVTAVTISAPILPRQPTITLQRLENTAGAADAAWQVVHRGEGTQGPQTTSADSALVQALLVQLTLLSAKTFESDAPTSADLENWGFNRPEREIRLEFAGNSTPVVLRLGTDARREVYARVGTPNDQGLSVYSVEPDILRELRPEPLAWRNRVVYELSASARIASLKLTDLASATMLFETTLTAAGEPASPVSSPAALQEVLTHVRKLQAKRFVSGTFAERVMVRGREEPWRFRLDLALALPAGATAAQTGTLTLFFSERTGGAQQLVGSRELDAMFELEQPLLDALWPLTEGARDPGPLADTRP